MSLFDKKRKCMVTIVDRYLHTLEIKKVYNIAAYIIGETKTHYRIKFIDDNKFGYLLAECGDMVRKENVSLFEEEE